MGKTNFKFKRTESFRFRDGWIESALNVMNANPNTNIFSKNDGVRYLGIGSNMVKSVRYWVEAMGLVTAGSKGVFLNDTAKRLLEKDPYLEDFFSWYFLHYQLVTNEEDAPVFYYAFNNYRQTTIEKQDLIDEVYAHYNKEMGGTLNMDSVASDVTVFFQSYYADEKEKALSPEDLTICPFSNLGLMNKDNPREDIIRKTEPAHNNLDHLLVFYTLHQAFKGKPFSIDGALDKEKGPCKVFNLSRNSLSLYLSQMRQEGLVDINRTANLNMIYFKEEGIDEDWLFDRHAWRAR